MVNRVLGTLSLSLVLSLSVSHAGPDPDSEGHGHARRRLRVSSQGYIEGFLDDGRGWTIMAWPVDLKGRPFGTLVPAPRATKLSGQIRRALSPKL